MWYKYVRVYQKAFVAATSFFSGITLSGTPLKCLSMNNQECKVRSEIINDNIANLYFIIILLK